MYHIRDFLFENCDRTVQSRARYEVPGSNWSHDDILQQWMPMLQPECEINEETFDTEDLWLAQVLID